DDIVYVLEVNPRASRTVPFVSKAAGVPLAEIASRGMTGRKLSEVNLPDELPINNVFIKGPVFPFNKFPGVDPVLGPEMRSTGEVMGMAENFGAAFAKAQMGANAPLPTEGTAFISVNDNDKKNAVRIAKRLHDLGFKIVATRGTAGFLNDAGVHCERVFKVNEGRPNVVDLIKSDEIDLIVNTPLGRSSYYDERAIRRAAMQYSVVTFTTLTGANAAANAIAAMRKEGKLSVISLQEHHA
ncbi:MAG TPA: carbamoyl phosphate synthase large subunit, partial [Blastocatellia bacterium]|nr:carbamoyl phosphate synthase large subunit [Blastocatellia bacterium]